MPSIHERNAAFDAAKAVVVQVVPSMFLGYVHDDVVLRITDAALHGAERARKADEQKAAPPPAPVAPPAAPAAKA